MARLTAWTGTSKPISVPRRCTNTVPKPVARGHIRICPNEDIVFVILANRRTGRDPIPLGRLIGEAILAPSSARQARDAEGLPLLLPL